MVVADHSTMHLEKLIPNGSMGAACVGRIYRSYPPVKFKLTLDINQVTCRNCARTAFFKIIVRYVRRA